MADRRRVYEIFLFNGRVILGPDARILIVAISMFTGPAVIFYIFVARHLVHRFPAYNAGYAILVVSIVFTIYVLALLLFTATRDPGIVPRNSHPPEVSESDRSVAARIGMHFPPAIEIMVNGMPVWVEYCDTWMLYQPPRCSHCSRCDNCVKKFDNHLGWPMYWEALLSIFVFAMSALYIKFLTDDYGTVWKAMKHSPASVILMAYCFFCLCFVGGLSSFHLYLISTNQTTSENIRRRRNALDVADRRPNVFDKGCFGNFFEVFCAKIKPSRNDFRAFVQEAAPEPAIQPPILEESVDEYVEGRRAKVEDDLEIGNHIFTLTRRCDLDEAGDIKTKSGNRSSGKTSGDEVDLGSDLQPPDLHPETSP
ncbi:S-acyltransferase 8-like protein [Drosera capensis]